MNNKSEDNTSKGKMYLTVVAMASLLVMAFNVNSNMNASASIFSNIQNSDDIGQSLECVIVVVGCDAVGSVGSSGDVIVGTGDNDGGDDPLTCEECFNEYLTPEQIQAFVASFGDSNSLAGICAEIMADPELLLQVEQVLLLVFEVDAEVVEDLIACIEEALNL